MKKIGILATIALTALLFFALYPGVTIAGKTPRRDLDIIWYFTPDAAFTAMKNNEVDIIQWSLSKEQLQEAEADPNLCVAAYAEMGMFQFDFNNNKTIMDYPGKTNPMSITEVRIAIDHLIDVDWIVANILEYFGSRIDAPVAYPSTEGWVDLSVVTFDQNKNGVIEPTEDNYPYKYSLNQAARILAQLGFSDTDRNGYLNYPDNPDVWMGAAGIDTTLMPLKITIRSDHVHRREAGRYLYRQLEGDPAVAGDSALAAQPGWAEFGKVGGDFDTTDETWNQPRGVLGPIVFRDRNYHIYTGGWSLGRFPTYLFFIFHSMFWYPYGPNYVKAPGSHDDLDPLLEDIYYTDSLENAQVASRAYTREHVLRNINRPLWSYTSYVAWRKTLAGVINMNGYGTVNDFTFINAYRTTGPGPVRMGVASGWDRLNILYSQWYFEYAFLDRVYTGLISVNPYILAIDQPWVAQDWETGTWIDPRDGYEKTVVTYWFRKDAGCAAPVTGVPSGTFKAEDYIFTCWYNYAFDDSWQWSSFMDLHHVEKISDYQVKVYFDDLSYWFVYAPTGPLLGPKTVLDPLLCETRTATFTGADLVEVSPGYFEYQFTTDQVVEVISATRAGSPIYEDTHFYIRAGYDTNCHNVFVAKTTFLPTDTIVITYRRPRAGGAGGTYLGGNLGYDWRDTMYSYGTHYPISISSTSASLNKNPYFFPPTALLGEIDWRWTFVGVVKPRSGYFQITILDVVRCTAAYSANGYAKYNPAYFPGADIDASDLGHVGILDLVTITGQYARTFDIPP